MLDRFIKITHQVMNLVNASRSYDSRTRKAIVPIAIRKQFIKIAHLMGEMNLTTGTLSELSVRLPGGKYAINSAGSQLATMMDDEIVIVGIEKGYGVTLEVNPARLNEWHRKIYQLTDTGAVLIAHSLYASVFNQIQKKPDLSCFISALEIIEGIADHCQKFEMLEMHVRKHDVLFAKGIGVIYLGQSLDAVLEKAEILERCCQMNSTLIVIGGN